MFNTYLAYTPCVKYMHTHIYIYFYQARDNTCIIYNIYICAFITKLLLYTCPLHIQDTLKSVFRPAFFACFVVRWSPCPTKRTKASSLLVVVTLRLCCRSLRRSCSSSYLEKPGLLKMFFLPNRTSIFMLCSLVSSLHLESR